MVNGAIFGAMPWAIAPEETKGNGNVVNLYDFASHDDLGGDVFRESNIHMAIRVLGERE